MRRPFRGDMPVPLTLPLHFDLNLAVRRRRLRRVAVAALAVLGAALLACGFWLPAKAKPAHDSPFRTLTELAVGDVFALEHADGTVLDYEVIALDVVDSERAEFAPQTHDGIVVLVTRWPLDAARVSGSWRYVVTARRKDPPGLSF
jgi:hypothetical protein